MDIHSVYRPEDLRCYCSDCGSESFEIPSIDTMEVGPVREHGLVISNLAMGVANVLVRRNIRSSLDQMVQCSIQGSIPALRQRLSDKWSLDQLEASTANWLSEMNVSGEKPFLRPWVWSSAYLSDDNESESETGRSVDLCFCLFRALYVRLYKQSVESNRSVEPGHVADAPSSVDVEDCLEELGMTDTWRRKRCICCPLSVGRRVFVRDLNSVQLWALCPLLNLTTSWIVADLVDHESGKAYFEMEMSTILDMVTECLRTGVHLGRGPLDCAALFDVDHLS